MNSPTLNPSFEFRNATESVPVDLAELEMRIIEFLELYADYPLVNSEFRSIIGDGDGLTRFSRLLSEAGYQNDPQGFLNNLLDQLERLEVGSEQRVAFNGLQLPYHLLMVALEQVLPGEKIFKVQTVRRLEKLTNTKVPDKDRSPMRQVLDLYPVRFSSHVIRQMRLSNSIAYQFMPDLDELNGEGLAHTWVGQFHRGVIEQMYRNRVIFVLNMSCPVYCRFCFRKHKECRNQRAPCYRTNHRTIDSNQACYGNKTEELGIQLHSSDFFRNGDPKTGFDESVVGGQSVTIGDRNPISAFLRNFS